MSDCTVTVVHIFENFILSKITWTSWACNARLFLFSGLIWWFSGTGFWCTVAYDTTHVLHNGVTVRLQLDCIMVYDQWVMAGFCCCGLQWWHIKAGWGVVVYMWESVAVSVILFSFNSMYTCHWKQYDLCIFNSCQGLCQIPKSLHTTVVHTVWLMKADI